MGDEGIGQVRPGNLYTYGKAVGELWIEAARQPILLTHMGPTVRDAFLPLNTGPKALAAGQFAPAGTVAQQQSMAQEAFRQFLGDLGQGFYCLGSAATVFANSYEGTDIRSAAATVQAVSYAFGQDGTARPAGLPSTIADETFTRGAQGEPLPEALTATDDTAASSTIWGGPLGSTTVHTFTDGSTRSVTHMNTAGTVITVTTERGADGTVLGSRTVETVERDGRAVRQTVRDGDSTTTTVWEGDHSVVTTQVGDEAPVETTVHTPGAAPAGDTDHQARIYWPQPIEEEEVKQDFYLGRSGSPLS